MSSQCKLSMADPSMVTQYANEIYDMVPASYSTYFKAMSTCNFPIFTWCVIRFFSFRVFQKMNYVCFKNAVSIIYRYPHRHVLQRNNQERSPRYLPLLSKQTFGIPPWLYIDVSYVTNDTEYAISLAYHNNLKLDLPWDGTPNNYCLTLGNH